MSEHVLPLPPESTLCPKCLRRVTIAATPNRVFESECNVADCPITNDPENKVGELWGTSISFEEPSTISQEGRIARFAQWEKIGLDAIKADLNTGGSKFVGGPPEVRALAREWVRNREANTQKPTQPQSSELLSLKPGMWGVNVDLKELWRRARRWWLNRTWFR
jgi:hypothetical protein